MLSFELGILSRLPGLMLSYVSTSCCNIIEPPDSIVFVCKCVVRAYVHVCGHVHTSIGTCAAQRSTSGVFLDPSPLSFLRQGLTLNLELSRPAGEQAPGSILSTIPMLPRPGF